MYIYIYIYIYLYVRVVPNIMKNFQVTYMSFSNPPFVDIPCSDQTHKIS